MRTLRKLWIVACVVLLGSALFSYRANADEWNKETKISVNQPLEIPGRVLSPGRYVLKLADSPSNRHIVQVWNEDKTELLALILALPNYRLEAGETEIGFWERPDGSPVALRSWFYPSDNFGQEFVYPKRQFRQIAAKIETEEPAVEQVASAPSTMPEAEAPPPPAEHTATVTQPEPEKEQSQTTSPYAETPQNDGQSKETTTPAQQSSGIEKTAKEESADTLPTTASPFPLIGLLGLVSLGGALILRFIRRQVS